MKGSSKIIAFAFAVAASAISSHAATLVHRWSFNDGTDTVGGANATLVGAASYTGGQLELPGGGVRANYASVNIGATIASQSSITVESWYTQDVVADWRKIWMFGTPNGGAEPGLSYIDFTPYVGLNPHVPKIDFDSATSGTELNTIGGVDPAVQVASLEYFVATVYDFGTNTMSLYINGTLADSAGMGGAAVSALGNTTQNFFGAAVNFGDPDIDGRINEMRIWSGALTPAEVTSHFALGPNVVPEPSIATLAGLALLGLSARRRR